MNIVKKLIRNVIWQALSFLPKEEKKVVCQSFYGRGWSDSPGAIGNELLKRGWHVYWTLKSKEDALSLPEGVTPIKPDSLKGIYHQCTASAWVDNCRKWGYTKKRGKTKYIQTWHGFPLKRIEVDAISVLDKSYVRAAKLDSDMCDLFISNSSFLSELYLDSFWYYGEVLECGSPRNDILFAPPEPIERKVRERLHVPKDKKLALYAPTFRQDLGLDVYDMDYGRVCRALSERFGGDWLILAKLHPNIASKAKKLSLDPEYVLNASDYADIQELYVACHALLTDYSSVMFDYMNTGRPCFLYVNDMQDYKRDRNLYFNAEHIPFAMAEDNDKLEAAILAYDENTQKERVAWFSQGIGLKEEGTAAKQAADWLEAKMQGKFAFPGST